MPFYHRLGRLPNPKHTTFYKEDGVSLYREELFSTLGFSGVYSNKYHIHMPTELTSVTEKNSDDTEHWVDHPIQYCHFFTDNFKKDGNYITSRASFLRNVDCDILCAYPAEDTELFYRNAYAYEYIFVHRGKGRFLSEFGLLPFKDGDQIICPRGAVYRMEFDSWDNNKLLIIESPTPFDIPKHYRNDYGQLEEHAPYCERDLKAPEYMEQIDETGEFHMILKAGARFFDFNLPHHPFDLVGWDGFAYPYIFNIKDFKPIVGKIHLPPPVHLAFHASTFVVCNFCPRLFDFHPKSIPTPYFHSNVDSDEVLYYVEGDFMSRKGVEVGSITHHPLGMPHGPQPGKPEE